MGRVEGNIEHPTSNFQHREKGRIEKTRWIKSRTRTKDEDEHEKRELWGYR